MKAGASVEVMRSALSRAWRRAEYEEIWLQFRCRDHGVVADVEAAVEVANTAVDDAGWGDGVFAEAVSESEAGPVVLMSRAGPEEGVWAWFAAFAGHLDERGRAGKVTAAPQAHLPEWLGSGLPPLPFQPAAFVSYTPVDLASLDPRARERCWNVDPEVTRIIAAGADAWARFSPADVYLRRDLHQIRTNAPDVSASLADGLSKFGTASVIFVHSRSRAFSEASFDGSSEAVYQRMTSTEQPIALVDSLRQILTALPAHTDLGFIKYSYPPVISWASLDSAKPLLPYIEEYHLRANRHLTTDFVPDVHGIQLLTPQHLDRARSLRDWSITELDGDRYLVEAADLDAWYANTDPDPEILAAARSDFGDMILTPEAISANPPPWRVAN